MDSPEHDGGFFRARQPKGEWHLALLLDMERKGLRVTWKQLPESIDEMKLELQQQLGGDWTFGDGMWIQRMCCLLRAIPLRFVGSPPHMDFAEGIAHFFEGKLCRSRKALEVWDDRLRTWSACEDGETLLERLRPFVSKALHAEAREGW